MERQPYPSDLTDDEWEILRPSKGTAFARHLPVNEESPRL